MKDERNYLTISLYVLLGALLVVLFTACVYRFEDVLAISSTIWNALKPVVLGIVIALAVNPIYSTLYNRVFRFKGKHRAPKILRKTLSLIVTYLILIAVLISLGAAVLPQIINSCEEIATKSTAYLTDALNWLESQMSVLSIPNFLLLTSEHPQKEPLENIQTLPIDQFCSAVRFGIFSPVQQSMGDLNRLLKERFILIDLSTMLQNFLDRSVATITDMIPSLIGSFNHLLNEMKNLLLGIVISIYFLVAKERMRGMTLKLLTTVFGKKINHALQSFGRVTYLVYVEFMIGKLIDSIIVMMITFTVMRLFGMPYPILLACIVGIANLIPYLGPIIGTAICSCIVFVFAPVKTLLFLILVLVIQQLDLHLLEPHIIASKQYLSNFAILVSVIVMGRAFGLFGCFLAAPTFSVGSLLLRNWEEKRLLKLGYVQEGTPDASKI